MDKKKPKKQSPKVVIMPVRKDPSRKKLEFDYYIIFLWVAICFISLIRYRLITVPFERDEGEYGYIGNMLLHGIAPFKDAYSMKLPGTSFMYSFFMVIFGHSVSGVHTGLLFMNAATMYFLFAAFKNIFNSFIGLATATIYGIMALNPVFDGFAAHATHFICFYSSIASLFLANFIQSDRVLKIFLCGLMLGIAFLMKQQAFFLALFGGIFLFIHLKAEKKQGFTKIIRTFLIFSTGVFIPYIIFVLIILFTGEFHNFWLWTVEYASKYETLKRIGGGRGGEIIHNFKSTFLPIWDYFYCFWIFALGGILVLYLGAYTRLQKLFTLLYFIASACIVSSGFYFREHYYIVFLPVLGLLTGIFLDFNIKQIREKMKVLKSHHLRLIVLSVLVLFNIYDNRKYYFSLTPKMVCSMTYWGNPFEIAQEISTYIHNNTNDTDKIAVLGSEPEVCFYANRLSATGYLYTYPLVENQPYNEIMQEQMIQEIEKNKPTFLIDCNIPFSWMAKKDAPQTIFQWINEYSTGYTRVGVADFYWDKGWQIYWNEDMNNQGNQPDASIIILKRKSE